MAGGVHDEYGDGMRRDSGDRLLYTLDAVGRSLIRYGGLLPAGYTESFSCHFVSLLLRRWNSFLPLETLNSSDLGACRAEKESLGPCFWIAGRLLTVWVLSISASNIVPQG